MSESPDCSGIESGSSNGNPQGGEHEASTGAGHDASVTRADRQRTTARFIQAVNSAKGDPEAVKDELLRLSRSAAGLYSQDREGIQRSFRLSDHTYGLALTELGSALSSLQSLAQDAKDNVAYTPARRGSTTAPEPLEKDAARQRRVSTLTHAVQTLQNGMTAIMSRREEQAQVYRTHIERSGLLGLQLERDLLVLDMQSMESAQAGVAIRRLTAAANQIIGAPVRLGQHPMHSPAQSRSSHSLAGSIDGASRGHGQADARGGHSLCGSFGRTSFRMSSDTQPDSAGGAFDCSPESARTGTGQYGQGLAGLGVKLMDDTTDTASGAVGTSSLAPRGAGAKQDLNTKRFLHDGRPQKGLSRSSSGRWSPVEPSPINSRGPRQGGDRFSCGGLSSVRSEAGDDEEEEGKGAPVQPLPQPRELASDAKARAPSSGGLGLGKRGRGSFRRDGKSDEEGAATGDDAGTGTGQDLARCGMITPTPPPRSQGPNSGGHVGLETPMRGAGQLHQRSTGAGVSPRAQAAAADGGRPVRLQLHRLPQQTPLQVETSSLSPLLEMSLIEAAKFQPPMSSDAGGPTEGGSGGCWEGPQLRMWPRPPPAPPSMAASRHQGIGRRPGGGGVVAVSSEGQAASFASQVHAKSKGPRPIDTSAGQWTQSEQARRQKQLQATSSSCVRQQPSSSGLMSRLYPEAPQERRRPSNSGRQVYRRIHASERLLTAQSTADYRPSSRRPEAPAPTEGLHLLASLLEEPEIGASTASGAGLASLPGSGAHSVLFQSASQHAEPVHSSKRPGGVAGDERVAEADDKRRTAIGLGGSNGSSWGNLGASGSFGRKPLASELDKGAAAMRFSPTQARDYAQPVMSPRLESGSGSASWGGSEMQSPGRALPARQTAAAAHVEWGSVGAHATLHGTYDSLSSSQHSRVPADVRDVSYASSATLGSSAGAPSLLLAGPSGTGTTIHARVATIGPRSGLDLRVQGPGPGRQQVLGLVTDSDRRAIAEAARQSQIEAALRVHQPPLQRSFGSLGGSGSGGSGTARALMAAPALAGSSDSETSSGRNLRAVARGSDDPGSDSSLSSEHPRAEARSAFRAPASRPVASDGVASFGRAGVHLQHGSRGDGFNTRAPGGWMQPPAHGVGRRGIMRGEESSRVLGAHGTRHQVLGQPGRAATHRPQVQMHGDTRRQKQSEAPQDGQQALNTSVTSTTSDYAPSAKRRRAARSRRSREEGKGGGRASESKARQTHGSCGRGENGTARPQYGDKGSEAQPLASSAMPRTVAVQRRKNLPAETKAKLIDWLFDDDHIEYPYPTDEEKEQLSRTTKLPLERISNFFINARVRVWAPRVKKMGYRIERDRAGKSHAVRK